MNFPSTQVTIDSIKNFLQSPLQNGLTILIFSVFFTFLITAICFRLFYEPKLNRHKETVRSKERALADVEAKEAQILSELDDLQKGEAILINRNGTLSDKVEEYKKLCDEQEKLITALEENLAKRNS